ncbi:hypothetical protein MKA87_004391 [Salmonella enterica]|uniref:hypothetical protein n=1 Tax=Salmonella enterica TaxID=28901 RepID=UPI00331451D0|nr:hypothetical protein [Salmonella enterica]EIX3644994.1 hypothetical protein [Salmonella enterica]EIX8205405.1 hypothetical protein [Salmonella enterica subsp. enterica serovar Infantis]
MDKYATNYTWVTKSGDHVQVPKMTTAHIINSLAWLCCDSDMNDEKDNLTVRKWIKVFTEELKRRNHV